MSKNHSLLIFTPTYNRAHTLKRCYESILKQNYDNFSWLIVDDGSTDDTKVLVDGFIKENLIRIKYVYQKNQGKQAAWNRAISLGSDFDLFLCVDSDDILTENALDSVKSFFPDLFLHEDVIGLRCIAVRHSTQMADSLFNEKGIKKDSWYEELKSNKTGERVDIFKISIIKHFLYPVNDFIKFVPECWLYCVSAKKYKFIYLPEKLTIFYDQHTNNRLSKSSIKQHALGQKIARGALLKMVPLNVWLHNPMTFIKTLVRYIQSTYYSHCNRNP